MDIINNVCHLFTLGRAFQTPECDTQVIGVIHAGLVPLVGIFGKGLSDDLCKNFRNLRTNLPNRNRSFIGDLVKDGKIIVPRKGLLTCQKLVKHTSQGKDVALVFHGPFFHLLRGHVTWGPDDAFGCGLFRLDLCDAKIRDAHSACLVEHYVGGLDISMDHPLFVGEIECPACSKHDFNNPVDGEKIFLVAKLFKGGAVNILHGDVAEILVHPGIIYGHDTGVHEPAGRLGLQEKPLSILVGLLLHQISGRSGDFDGHVSIDIGVFPEIDHPHTALAQLPYNFIPANGLDIR